MAGFLSDTVIARYRDVIHPSAVSGFCALLKYGCILLIGFTIGILYSAAEEDRLYSIPEVRAGIEQYRQRCPRVVSVDGRPAIVQMSEDCPL